MKKTNLLLMSIFLGLGVVSVSSLTSCNNNLNTLSKKEGFLLQAATSMNLVSSLKSAQRKAIKGKQLNEIQIDKVKMVLPTIDLLLDNGTSFNSKIESVETEIEGTVYKYKEIFTFKNSELKDETYTLVYNKSVQKEIFEDESVEYLKGYAIFDDQTKYVFNSIIETEEEIGETEVERSFKIQLDNSSFIQVEQENEVEGKEVSNEFEYTYVKNGVVNVNYSVEVERKPHKEEIEFEISNQEFEVTRKIDKDGTFIYHVSIENGRDHFELVGKFKKVVKEDGSVSYEVI